MPWMSESPFEPTTPDPSSPDAPDPIRPGVDDPDPIPQEPMPHPTPADPDTPMA
jgi:hypothetical protein